MAGEDTDWMPEWCSTKECAPLIGHVSAFTIVETIEISILEVNDFARYLSEWREVAEMYESDSLKYVTTLKFLAYFSAIIGATAEFSTAKYHDSSYKVFFHNARKPWEQVEQTLEDLAGSPYLYTHPLAIEEHLRRSTEAMEYLRRTSSWEYLCKISDEEVGASDVQGALEQLNQSLARLLSELKLSPVSMDLDTLVPDDFYLKRPGSSQTECQSLFDAVWFATNRDEFYEIDELLLAGIEIKYGSCLIAASGKRLPTSVQSKAYSALSAVGKSISGVFFKIEKGLSERDKAVWSSSEEAQIHAAAKASSFSVGSDEFNAEYALTFSQEARARAIRNGDLGSAHSQRADGLSRAQFIIELLSLIASWHAAEHGDELDRIKWKVDAWQVGLSNIGTAAEWLRSLLRGKAVEKYIGNLQLKNLGPLGKILSIVGDVINLSKEASKKNPNEILELAYGVKIAGNSLGYVGGAGKVLGALSPLRVAGFTLVGDVLAGYAQVVVSAAAVLDAMDSLYGIAKENYYKNAQVVSLLATVIEYLCSAKTDRLEIPFKWPDSSRRRTSHSTYRSKSEVTQSSQRKFADIFHIEGDLLKVLEDLPANTESQVNYWTRVSSLLLGGAIGYNPPKNGGLNFFGLPPVFGRLESFTSSERATPFEFKKRLVSAIRTNKKRPRHWVSGFRDFSDLYPLWMEDIESCKAILVALGVDADFAYKLLYWSNDQRKMIRDGFLTNLAYEWARDVEHPEE